MKINARLGMTYAFVGRMEAAFAQCDQALELDPNSAEAHMCVGSVRERAGSYRQAREAFERAGELGYRTAPHVARVLALAGEHGEARRLLRALEDEHRQGRAWSPYDLAKVSNALGDKPATFAWLETAYREHDDTLVAIGVEPEWERLRSDPRFAALAQKVAGAPRQGLRVTDPRPPG